MIEVSANGQRPYYIRGQRRTTITVLRSLTALIAAGLLLAPLGCRQDMHDQPKFFPQRGTTLFADGRSARLQVVGTVARSQAESGTYFVTGMNNGAEGDGLPLPLTADLLARGQERYNIYCTPCHSRVGNGEGMIVQRGYYQAANFHTERLRQTSLGHLFSVITNGYGAMPNYAAELKPEDRWAIVAYIRALQLSQHAKQADAGPGAIVLPLKQIAVQEGLPESFAQGHWGRPATAVSAPATAGTSATFSVQQQASATTPETAPAAGTPSTSPSAAPVAAETPKSGDKTSPLEAAANTETAKPGASAAKQPAAAPAAAGDAAGKQIYENNCQMCHQANRGGLPPMIPSLVDIVSRVGADHIRETVTNGVPTAKPPMPSFAGKLSSSDIDNLIAFLKTKP